jgi:hypothetical protein
MRYQNLHSNRTQDKPSGSLIVRSHIASTTDIKEIKIPYTTPTSTTGAQGSQINYAELPQDMSLMSQYCDMINQESDVFYLFDAFHSILNTLK